MIAAGLLLLTRIDPGDSYVSSVLPAVIVFGLGLTLVVAPVTATVLAAADARHSGIASGINNAVARVAGLLAVAVLPLIAGLTGEASTTRRRWPTASRWRWSPAPCSPPPAGSSPG